MVRVRNEREAVALCVHMGMQTMGGRGIGIGEWQCGREGRPFGGQPHVGVDDKRGRFIGGRAVRAHFVAV